MTETIHINPDLSEDFSSINNIYEALKITKLPFSGFARLKSMVVYVKSSSPISLKRRLKKAPRSTGPWRSAPRIREFRNLLKLRERGFPAARPLIAAEKRVFGFLERQLLITERIADSASLFDLAVQGKLEQDQLLAINWRLGCLVGHMHNAGFCHRDLFMRNIVVGLNDAEPSLHFIDCHQAAGHDSPVEHLHTTLAAMKNGQQRFLMKRPEGTSLRDTLKRDLVKILKNCSASPIEPASNSFFDVKSASERLTKKDNFWIQRSNPNHSIRHSSSGC